MWDDLRDEFMRSTHTRPDGGAPQVDAMEVFPNSYKSFKISQKRLGVSFELESERRQNGILELRSTDFDDGIQFCRFATQHQFERFEGGQEGIDLANEGDLGCRRANVIRRLLIIDIVENRNAVIRALFEPEQFECAIGNDFVDIHIERSPSTTL